MGRNAIEVERLGKRYRLGEDFGARYVTLRETLGALAAGRRVAGERVPEVWALRDVDLAVEEGEVLGVIGRNGAGKSTLLKILARITEPTTGVARTRGRVGALLDVGTGFHPELTGRENVYLNGAILGMPRRAIAARFDDIVEFAAIGDFLDTPLKRYSSGMSLRLAFAVAAHVEPPIIVVDEVLAVGDAEFQRRCLGKMSELRREGRTVVFVSHDLGAIRQLCPRTVWLDEGRVQADGPSGTVVDRYLASGLGGAMVATFPARNDRSVELRSVAVTDSNGVPVETTRRHEPLCIRVRFVARRRVPDLDIAIYVLDRRGVRVLDEAWSDTGAATDSGGRPGEYEAALTVPPVLAAGEYVVGVWIGSTIGAADETFVDQEALTLRLSPHPHDRAEWTERSRIVHPPVEWALRRDPGEHAPTAPPG